MESFNPKDENEIAGGDEELVIKTERLETIKTRGFGLKARGFGLKTRGLGPKIRGLGIKTREMGMKTRRLGRNALQGSLVNWLSRREQVAHN